MRRIKGIILAGGLLMLAFSGIASASASAALPEFSVAKASFGVSPSAPSFETVGGGAKWEYGRATGLGALISGPKEISDVALTFDEARGGIGACYNEKGSLVLNQLHGRLGYINKAKTEVGLLLEPKTQLVVECSNDAGGYQWHGSMIGRVTPVNTLTKELTVTFQYHSGKQELKSFEGEEALHSLEWTCGCELGMKLEMKLKNFIVNEKQVSLEVKA